MAGYNLRKYKKGETLKVRTTEEYLARLKELEPEAERIKEQMRRQLQLTADVWNFMFTV